MDLRKEKSASFETHLTGQFPDSHFLLRHFSHFQLNSNTKMGTHFINISFLFYFLKNQLCKKYLLPAKGIGSWMALMVIGIEAGYSDDLRLHPTQFCSLFVFKMGQPRPLFRLFSSFQTNITILTTNKCEKMSIQYPAPGFELTTF